MEQAVATADDVDDDDDDDDDVVVVDDDDDDDDDDARDMFSCMRSLRATDFSCAAALRNILGSKHHDSFPRGSFAGHSSSSSSSSSSSV